MSVQSTCLPCGIRVVTDQMDHVATVSVGAWVGVGARYESAADNGLSHLLEHMVFKGTENRDARSIAEAVEDVGGFLNAYTGRETTAFYAKTLTDHFDLALTVIADLLQAPLFDVDELVREKDVVLQEIGQAQDTPDDIIFDRLQEVAYPRQALGRPVLGTADNVSGFSRQDLQRHLKAGYTAGRLVIAASGAVTHEQVVAAVERLFAGIPAGVAVTAPKATYQGGDYREVRALEQVHLTLSLPGVPIFDPDHYAAVLFSSMLGGGMSSRLFQEVREKLGLVYSIYAFHAGYRDAGLFTIYAGTGADDVTRLMPVISAQLRALTDAPAQAELDRARAQMKAGLLMSLESTSARAEQLAQQMLIWGRPVALDEIVARIDDVSRDDIRRVGQRLLTGRPTVAAIGPIQQLADYDHIADSLAA